MRTNTKKLLGAVAVAGVVAAGGTAFTASVTMAKPVQNIGAGSQVVSGGAHAQRIDYALTQDGQTIDFVKVTFVGDLRGKLVESSFEHAPRTTCTFDGIDQQPVEGDEELGWNVLSTTFICQETTNLPTSQAEAFSLLVTDPANVDDNVSRVAS